MLQRELHRNFTGFIAYYEDGKSVKEKENYFSKTLKKNCATNWAEINKEKLVALELFWRGQSIIKIDKSEHPEITPNDWFFTQSAIFEMKNRKLTILSRNIGYKKGNILQIFSVEETSGRLTSHVRG